MAEGRHVFRSKSRVKGLEMSDVIGLFFWAGLFESRLTLIHD